MGQNGGLVDLVNNYICNYTQVGTTILFSYTYCPRANIVGNVYAYGPSTHRPVHTYNGSPIPSGSFYTLDNLSDVTPLPSSDPWLIMGSATGTWPDYILDRSAQRLTPWPVPGDCAIAADPAANVVDLVLADVGANLPARDSLDQRLVAEAQDGTGDPGFGSSILNHEDWPVLANGTPYPDTDVDGMADTWETARGLDPGDPGDGPLDDDGDGYTNLEEFLNSLVGE
jgi:hypothetical protein